MSHRENDMDLEIQPGVPRRKFLGMLGASMALAGVTTSGCIRRPKEYIYPENNRAENTLPGVAKQYATNALVGSGVLALSVTSMDGRPTKIDGSSAFAQAEILNLYDPDRGQFCLHKKEKASKSDILKALKSTLVSSKAKSGEEVAFLFESFRSPAFYDLISQISKSYPKALFVEQDSTYSNHSKKGLSAVAGTSADVVYDFSKANVILAVDSDFLGLEGDSIKNARQFAQGRRIVDTNSTMNRLYSVESCFSTTGAAADHRYALPGSQIESFLVGLCKELTTHGVTFSSEVMTQLETYSHNESPLNSSFKKWIQALAKDLASQKGKSIVAVGDKQPSHLHALGFAINLALGSVATSIVQLVSDPRPSILMDVLDLKKSIENNSVKSLIIIGGNPVFTQPADVKFLSLLDKVTNSFYFGFSPDETAQLSKYYIPQTHFLESWGDALATDGTYSIRQPLIAPIYEDCMSEYELLLECIDDKPKSSYETIKSFCKQKSRHQGDFETNWRLFLANGFVQKEENQISQTQKFNFSSILNKKSAMVSTDEYHIEIEFALDQTVYDGRYANNAWMQEIPNSINKLVWDNALLVNPKTAKMLGISGNPKPGKSDVDVVKVTYLGNAMEIAVWEVPGIADSVGVISLGYGKTFGRVAKGTGFNANAIRTSDAWFGNVAEIEKTGKKYSLVSTQEHGSLNGTPGMKKDRPAPLREATYEEFLKNPSFVLADELLPVAEQKNNLFKYPQNPAQEKWARQQWGMSIDLTTCIGCNACTVACQAENNISIVGKEEVFRNREMSWIRIDRYFSGSIDDPEVRSSFQPMNCQHCENAPCEAVCPVVATAHSPDGLNDMAYNRCVGTRYCANNCPYKVRRYNFFNYSKADDERNPLYAMQKNPNVTVRFRGVMEKCSYCVQRINAAKAEANRTSLDGLVPDGAIVTACQSACPTQSIAFGDVANPLSMVSKLKAQKRNYSVLGELNTKPRTTYLAKLRNVNPEIG
jgi:molybdopterin-containing oxidoreductase family iron-sulfur binding subunit